MGHVEAQRLGTRQLAHGGPGPREYMGIFMQGGIVWVPRLLLGDVRREFGLPSTANTMRVADRTVVYDEWAEVAMKSGHHEWYTLTVKPDVRFAMEVFEQGQKMFDGKGLWTIAFQPLPGHMFRDGEAVLSEWTYPFVTLVSF